MSGVKIKAAAGGGSTELQGPANTGNNTVLKLPSADGSANQLLKTDGSGNLGWATDSTLTSVLNASAETAWTSVGTGTDFTFTGLSASAKRFTLLANSISFNGGNNFQLRIGDSGGVETSGYITESYYAGGSSSGQSVTDSFEIHGTGTASYRQNGSWEFWNLDGNTWYCQAFAMTADGTSPSGGHMRAAQGVKTLSGTLDRIQIYSGGSNLDLGTAKLITWT